MTPLTLVIVAFVLALLLFGFAFWTPIYAVPLALLFVLGLGISEMVRRRGVGSDVRDFRSQSPGRDEVDFSDRDRETLYERDR